MIATACTHRAPIPWLWPATLALAAVVVPFVCWIIIDWWRHS